LLQKPPLSRFGCSNSISFGFYMKRRCFWYLFLLAAVVLTGARVLFVHYPRPPSVPYAAGAHIDDFGELGLDRSPRTLILITKSNCPFCNKSLSFYRKIAAIAALNNVRLISVTPEDPAINKSYLTVNNIEVSEVLPSSETTVTFTGTPTLILIAQSGDVIQSWTGLLSESQQNAVVASLSAHRGSPDG